MAHQKEDSVARWYVIHTYSGYENKVKTDLEKMVKNRELEDFFFEIVVPMEEQIEIKEGKRKGLETIVATFSEQNICKEDECFDGASLDAVFGSILLDLRKAKIEKEAVISVSAIFGGIDILVPSNTNVKVKATPIFGGVSNRVSKKDNHEKTIYIEAFCLFGGIDIK